MKRFGGLLGVWKSAVHEKINKRSPKSKENLSVRRKKNERVKLIYKINNKRIKVRTLIHGHWYKIWFPNNKKKL